ncbi:MAG: ribonuclease Y [Deltaproteobacteria bacterium]|nr:ribonuclease Y [Deltaproteobacteria bacterium]
MTPLYIIAALIAGLAIGLAVAWALQRGQRGQIQAAKAEAERALAAAKDDAAALKKSAELEAQEQAFKLKSEGERELATRKAELARREEQVQGKESDAARRIGELERKETEVGRAEKAATTREQQAEAAAKKAETALAEAKGELEKVAGMTAEQARDKLAAEVADEARKQAAIAVRKIEDETRTEAENRSKKIISTAIQRYASEYVAERTVSVVALPSDDMKGRIIGREGRNIRALEAATGIDLIIDDTPEAVIISCFNPVRREIAKIALSRLIADGRIHPTRIEEVVQKASEEIDQQAKEAGEQAAFDLGISRMHPELTRMLGRLKFRSSHAQNLLLHSVEVGFLAGVMAGELGLNVKQARRAGLLHDIGKAADQEVEGSHAAVGAELARKLGEAPRVVHAIAAHHGEVPPESVLDNLVDAANQLSGQRPGARREQLESYVKRLGDLEKLCTDYPGVEKAFAIQAGREVRVMVENASVSDDQSVLMSKEIAKRIEDTMQYPGQVRVCVIRETRATEYAK